MGVSHIEFEPNTAKSFTRGGGTYLFDGKRAGVASFDTPKALGERIGRVTKVVGGRFAVDSTLRLATGDGVCFITGGEAVGTNINAVEGQWITPTRIEGIKVGTELYRNFDRLFSAAVERSRIRRAIEVSVEVVFTDKSITATATDCTGVSASVTMEISTDEAKNAEKMEAVVVEQMSKSGQTIFDVVRVDVSAVRFVPASVVAGLRRELLAALEQQRVAVYSHSRGFEERVGALYPRAELTEQDNVTNAVAREFYADHGVKSIASGLDIEPTTVGHRVMVTDYCIRREIGQCLLCKPTISGELFLERGRKRYKLVFDCKKCQMSLIDTL